MSDFTYQTIRSANQAREAEEQRNEARKKNLLILVMHYLSEEGYVESAQSLSRETNLDFRRYEVCDNVDLETVLLEYESYYFVKFHKYPRITKKMPGKETVDPADPRAARRRSEQSMNRRKTTLPQINSHQIPSSDVLPSPTALAANNALETGAIRKVNSLLGLSVDGKPDGSQKSAINSGRVPRGHGSCASAGVLHCTGQLQQMRDGKDASKRTFPQQIIDFRSLINHETRLGAEEQRGLTENQERILKPIGGYAGYTGEWRDLALTISREIFLQNPDVRWDDIIGLSSAKRLVKEAVVYPIKYPQLFAGILSPWKGLLLYGPPGTGKTLLAKAVATECNTTFFNISASTIVSKWRGDSEKLVRVLFELARFHAPSTIFLDELDSLMSQRGSISGATACSGGFGAGSGGNVGGGGGGEHEGSRRMKTELLMQMDGLAKSDDLVFLLAASNLPWELDHAMLRRLEKRILVDLPNKEARLRMFEIFLPSTIDSSHSGGLQLKCQIDYDLVAELTEGYSGSDIRLVCKEAAMRVVRKIFDILEGHTKEDHPERHIHLDPVLTEDVQAAIASTMPSARQLAEKYQEWQRQFGSS
ncbi:Katanin p60 ATPase-containing subunit A 2 [Fasciola hepatica]|uniref:Katanin p60 ATPase-containing subunit A-like 2 n=1 Tax=Fasciola hepatica TaxID=6192 RepID=A0A4E0RVQ9_FASHE|nr:Katanin p60 ATPase-containing subunit A 2 [Fasciola hepatica]